MKTFVHYLPLKKSLFVVGSCIFFIVAFAQNGPAPELVFMNPVLKSGQDKKEGAVYRFSNITNGVDGELKLKKFSSASIVMNTVDNSALGWNKALQPEFGLLGLVQPNMNWYIDFELSFYQAGTKKKIKMSSVDVTALDVDGDGVSISEYVVMYNSTSVSYSAISYLLGHLGQVGGVGQSFMCPLDSITSPLMTCTLCKGVGTIFGWQCDKCDGSGKIYSECQDPFKTTSTVMGPIENFTNIDTLATQVMASYNYRDVDKISFRYGAKSGAVAVNGSGIRLNSLWFRQFSLAPVKALPVKLMSFNAVYNQDREVTLDWSTASEVNFSHFVVQRSTDGIQYTDAALIFTDHQITAYHYKDRRVNTDNRVLFYRLKMVDITEEVAYSAVRMIKWDKETGGKRLQVVPNPVNDQTRISFPSAWNNQPVLVELYTSAGVKVKEIKWLGNQMELSNLGKISEGAYFLRTICKGEVALQQIIKN